MHSLEQSRQTMIVTKTQQQGVEPSVLFPEAERLTAATCRVAGMGNAASFYAW